jgi:hypothetical protein
MSRLALLQSLESQLATITTANGYSTDIGLSVGYWDTYPDDYNGPDSVSFKDLETQYERVNQRYQNKLTIEVSAFAWTTKTDKITQSCQMLEDIYQCLVVEPWDNSVIAVRPMIDSKEIQARGKQAILVEMMLEIEYRSLAR